MTERISTPILFERAKKCPVITVAGLRQSGKATLRSGTFPQKTYVNLKQPETRRFATEDHISTVYAGQPDIISKTTGADRHDGA